MTMATNKRKELGVGAFISEAQAEAASKNAAGRPARKQSLLDRKLAKLVYLDQDTERELKMIKALDGYDFKEVIFAAVRGFVDEHYHGMGLDEEGRAKIDRIIAEYKVRE